MNLNHLLKIIDKKATAARPWVYMWSSALLYNPELSSGESLPNPVDVVSPTMQELYQGASVTRDLYASALGGVASIFRLPAGDQPFFGESFQAAIERFFPRVDNLVVLFKVIALVVIIASIIILVNIFLRYRKISLSEPPLLEELQPVEPAYTGAMSARWEEIMQRLDSPKESEWRFAIIEADKLTEEALKRAGYPGATMGERLINIPEGQLESLERLWESHKVRNRIVHDISHYLRYTEAKRLMAGYEQALRELKAV
ncbi:MAG: hypothetical protein Q8P35_01410 [Candidatus Yanofskybacteria bacterium]|nr:hypothetical protein [Candidatus Yanofskybacteria bacterium]